MRATGCALSRFLVNHTVVLNRSSEETEAVAEVFCSSCIQQVAGAERVSNSSHSQSDSQVRRTAGRGRPRGTSRHSPSAQADPRSEVSTL